MILEELDSNRNLVRTFWEKGFSENVEEDFQLILQKYI